MNRSSRFALVAVIGVAMLGALWLSSGVPSRPPAPPQRPASTQPAGQARAIAASIDDLLMDLQILPMDGQPPKAFELESLDGRRVNLAAFADRPLLLYFWATW